MRKLMLSFVRMSIIILLEWLFLLDLLFISLMGGFVGLFGWGELLGMIIVLMGCIVRLICYCKYIYYGM